MCPADQITEQAKAALGRDVQLHRFIITLRGRTGYLRPELEEEPIRGENGHLHGDDELLLGVGEGGSRLQRAMLKACLVLRDKQALCMQHSFQQCCAYAWCSGRNRFCRGGMASSNAEGVPGVAGGTGPVQAEWPYSRRTVCRQGPGTVIQKTPSHPFGGCQLCCRPCGWLCNHACNLCRDAARFAPVPPAVCPLQPGLLLLQCWRP